MSPFIDMGGSDRFDFDVISSWISPNERVLDLGCGDGAFLRFLQQEKGVRGYGVEIDPINVVACVANGINVIQSDLEEGLAGFEDGFFDHVVMSLSLQSVRHTKALLLEMLRVGREIVVTFPNFGHRSHRAAIAEGRMPISSSLPFQWFDTPNVRFFTIADFEALCLSCGFELREGRFFDERTPVTDDPNLNATLAIYRLGRKT